MTSIARATEIREAFGSCSTVFECMTPEEIVAEIEEDDELSWCKLELDCEDVRADRASYDDGDTYKEWVARRKVIVARLQNIRVDIRDPYTD